MWSLVSLELLLHCLARERVVEYCERGRHSVCVCVCVYSTVKMWCTEMEITIPGGFLAQFHVNGGRFRDTTADWFTAVLTECHLLLP